MHMTDRSKNTKCDDTKGTNMWFNIYIYSSPTSLSSGSKAPGICVLLDDRRHACSFRSPRCFSTKSSSLPDIFDNPFHSCLATVLPPLRLSHPTLKMTGSYDKASV